MKSLILSISNNEETLPKQLGCLGVDPNITPKFYTLRNTSAARMPSTMFDILYMIHIYFVFPFCFTGHYLTRHKIFVAFEQKEVFTLFQKKLYYHALALHQVHI